MNRFDPDSPIEAQLAAPPAVASQAASNSDQPARNDLFQSRLLVLAILFCVTGFFGLPLLWVNRRFSNVERIAWSLIVILYTCGLIAAVGWIVWWAWNRIN